MFVYIVIIWYLSSATSGMDQELIEESMKTSLPALVLCVISSINSVYSQTNQDITFIASPSFCCNSVPGPRVQVTPTDLADIVNESPYYEIIATPGFYNEGLDNACYTFFALGDTAFLRMTTLTYSNGTVVIQKYIVERLTGYPGVGRLQGLAIPSGSSSLIFDEVYLNSPCPGVRVYYRKYIAGSCSLLQDLIRDGTDFRHGDANTRSPSDYCLNQVVSIANSQNFNGSNFLRYPYKLNSNCVTQVNGMSCVNANKVRPQDTISITDTESSCDTAFY